MRKTEGDVNTQRTAVGQYPDSALLAAPAITYQWIRQHIQPHLDSDFTVQMFVNTGNVKVKFSLERAMKAQRGVEV
jgi:hypothetical protein